MKNALIVGSTGLIGGYLLEELKEKKLFKIVYVLSRRKLNDLDSAFENIVVDFETLNSVEIPEKIDVVFCALGTTIKKAGSKPAFEKVDYEYVINSAELGKKFGATCFSLVSAIGADENSTFFYNRVKGKTENKLKSLGYERLQIVRPSLLGGERKEFRFGEKIAQLLSPLFSIFLIGKLKKYRMVHGRKVAQTMLSLYKDNALNHCIIESDKINEV